MEDNDESTESYDENKIETLKQQICISKSELLQLAYNEQKFIKKLNELNSKGYNCIINQQFYQAIVYLNQAQSILEYAASCGKTIDRNLILTALHNQACVYQRIWELPKSATYLEAITFNISIYLVNQSAIQENFLAAVKNQQNQLKICSYFSSNLQLISYNLQFCAVSSQIKNHTNALNSAEKALSLLKNFCEKLNIYEKVVLQNNSQIENGLLFQLQSIRNFQYESDEQTQKNIQKLMYKAKKSIIVFQKKMKNTTSELTMMQIKQLQNFSLGQIMQVSPVQASKIQEKIDILHELTLIKKINKAIYISIAHFTMATELRLIANDKYPYDAHIKKGSKQFRQSQIHHLVSIITISLYVPCFTKYFQHILNSFKNHYQVDLTQFSEVSVEEGASKSLKDDLIHLEIQSVSERDSQGENSNLKSSIKNCRKVGLPQMDADKLIGSPKTTIDHFKRKNMMRNTTRQKNFASYTDNMTNSIQTTESQTRKKMLSKSNQQINTSLSKKKLGYKVKNQNEEKSPSKKVTKSKSNQKKYEIQTISNSRKIIMVEKVASRNTSKSKGKSPTKNNKKGSSKGKIEDYSHYYSGKSKSKEKYIKTYMQVDSRKVIKRNQRDSDQYEIKKSTRPTKYINQSNSSATKISKNDSRPSYKKKQNNTIESSKDFIELSEIPQKKTKKHKSPTLQTAKSQKNIRKV